MIKKKYYKSKPHCKVTFSLPLEAAQNCEDIRVVGDFNDWNWENGLVMKPVKAEYQASIELETGKNYEFRYQIDKEIWENDWAADDYSPSPFDGIENSVLSLESKPSIG